MISSFGHLAIIFALALALSGAITSLLGGRLRNPSLLIWGRWAAFVVLGLVTLAVALMEVALITHDFSVKYVSDVGSTTTPLYYTIISLWAALEGSILFWAFLLSLYTGAFLVIYRRHFLELQPYVTGVLLTISSFFLFIIAGPGDPFTRVTPAGPAAGCPSSGCGPNPLLQNHPMMGLHPPLLYLGYVGLSVPFAIALSSLIANRPGPEVLRLIRRWALIPWVFLSLGIVGGMWWSYAVLGWGGYWSWDPVENASVMPWLVTTAFLHSLQVQERRRMLKTWTMSLIISAFLLSVLGTFLTRSGVLASVHSFTQSAIGPIFLIWLALCLAVSIVLLVARSGELGAPAALDAIICRETAFLFNNLLLVGITFTILLGTLFPLIAQALQGVNLTVGAPYFNHIGVPIGFALLFLMGVGPVLPWGAARLEDLQWRFLLPVAIGVGTILLLLLAGVRGVGVLATLGLVGFVATVTVGRIVADTQARRNGTAESWPVALGRLLAANPRRYSGYLVHFGVLLAIVGIAASQSFQVRGSATLRPGQSLRVDGYTVTYLGLRPHAQPNRMVLATAVQASRDSEDLGVLTPSMNIYPMQQDPVVTPAVREEPWDMVYGLMQGKSPLPDLGQLLHGRNPFEDLYIVPQAIDTQNANTRRANRWATIQVLVNPFVDFIWLGGIIVGLGGFFALLPAARRRRVPVEAPEALRLQPEETPV